MEGTSFVVLFFLFARFPVQCRIAKNVNLTTVSFFFFFFFATE